MIPVTRTGALDDSSDALAPTGLDNVLNLTSAAVINNDNSSSSSSSNQDGHQDDYPILDVEINSDENDAGEESNAPNFDNAPRPCNGGGLFVEGRLPYRCAHAVAAPALQNQDSAPSHANAAPIHHVLHAAVTHAHLAAEDTSSSSSDDDASRSDGSEDSREDGSSSPGEEMSDSSSSVEDDESDDDKMDGVNNNLQRSGDAEQTAIPVAYLVPDEVEVQARTADLAGPLIGSDDDDVIPVIIPTKTHRQEETQTKSFKQFETEFEEERRYIAAIKILENVCRSRELSIEKLMECIEALPPNPGIQLNKSPMLHYAVRNDRVTFDIVECLMGYNPAASHVCMGMEAASIFPLQFPLHVACANPNCDDSIIELLLSSNPGALFHDACSRRLPLSFYLSRPRNVNLHMVRQLIQRYPKALTEVDNYRGTPVHTILCNPNVNDMFEIASFLLHWDPRALVKNDKEGRTPLRLACSKDISTQLFDLLMDNLPGGEDNSSLLFVHTFCNTLSSNENNSLQILTRLLRIYPESIRHVDHDG